jgi:cytochrome c-type biogenesis protein CcmF
MRSTPAADLYIVLNGYDLNQRIANVDMFLEPAVFWLWLGMAIVMVGGVIAAWPRRANMLARDVSELEGNPEELVLAPSGGPDEEATR